MTLTAAAPKQKREREQERATPPTPPIHEEPERAKGGRRLWSIEEFERLIDLGFFDPEERLELIGGEIVEKMTQNNPHATAINLTLEVLRGVFAEGHHLRGQMPLALIPGARPEPDVAVVTGAIRDYAQQTPTTAVLVVEISDTTLASDRTVKASLYAAAGIADYWIINLADGVLEIYREPAPMADQPFGHHYRSITRHTEAESIAPLARPDAPIAIAELLP